MTWFVLGCMAASVALAAALGGGLIWEARRSSQLSDKLIKAIIAEGDARALLHDAEEKCRDAGDAVSDLENSLVDEIDARKKAEAIAEKAIQDLIATGNAPAAAGRLRDDLARLQALSKVPPASTPKDS